MALHLGLPGDADLLLRRRLLEPRRLRRRPPEGPVDRDVHPRPPRTAAATVARVPGRLGGRAGRAPPGRRRRPHGTEGLGRHDAPPRDEATRLHDPVRPAVVPGRVPRRRRDRAGDDPAPSALRPVGPARDGAGSGRRGPGGVLHRRVGLAVAERRVRPAVPPSTRARVRGRDVPNLAPMAVRGDGRRRARAARAPDDAVAVRRAARSVALRLVPRDRPLPQEPARDRRGGGVERLPADRLLPPRRSVDARRGDADQAVPRSVAPAREAVAVHDRRERADHDAVPLAHDRVPAGAPRAVAAGVRDATGLDRAVVDRTPAVVRGAEPGAARPGGDLRALRAPDARRSGRRGSPPAGGSIGGWSSRRSPPAPARASCSS